MCSYMTEATATCLWYNTQQCQGYSTPLPALPFIGAIWAAMCEVHSSHPATTLHINDRHWTNKRYWKMQAKKNGLFGDVCIISLRPLCMTRYLYVCYNACPHKVTIHKRHPSLQRRVSWWIMCTIVGPYSTERLNGRGRHLEGVPYTKINVPVFV